MEDSRVSALGRLILDSLLLLIFFNLLTSFIEATYAIGLLGVELPPEMVFALLLLSPLLLLVFPGILDNPGFSLATGSLGILAWAISLPLGTRGRMVAAGFGCGLFLLFLPARLRQTRRAGAELSCALGLALMGSIALRSLRSGNLLLSDGVGLAVGLLLAAAASCLLIIYRREAASVETKAAPVIAEAAPAIGEAAPAGTGAVAIGLGRTIGLSIGLFACLVLAYFCFTSPAALARWGEASYPAVAAVQLGSMLLFLSLPFPRKGIKSAVLAIWNLVFTVALFVALYLRQPAFAIAAVYPLDAPSAGLLGAVSFWAMLVLHPVIYVDFAVLAGNLHEGRPSPRKLAAGFSAGAVFLLIAIFSQVFTTVYDYVPVIGSAFRDQSALVMSLPGLIIALTVWLGRRETATVQRTSSSMPTSTPAPTPAPTLTPTPTQKPTQRPTLKPIWLAAAAVLALGTVLNAVYSGANPVPDPEKRTLRILTFNVQQGYGKKGDKSVDEQLRAIRALRPDILGLQETDTARIANGNGDLIGLYAAELDMYSYYGPAPESGTFGIGLLSRYPIREPRTFFLPSKGEQAAAIEALITIGGKDFRVVVTHLGNDGPMDEQRALLKRLADGRHQGATVILMGDFNFKPSSEQYLLTAAGLEDAWLVAERKNREPGAPDPATKIDHIFLTSGTRVLDSVFLAEGPSDHPALFAEIGW